MNVAARRARAPRPGLPVAGWEHPAVEVLVVLLAALVGAAVVRGLVGLAALDGRSPVAFGVGPIWAAGMVALAAAACVAQWRWRGDLRARFAIGVLAGAAAGLAMGPLMAGLHGTSQPPFTVTGGDMAFRTEYVTRFADSWHLQDYTLKGLHAFYPPAWFWLAGRAAHVLGVVPWKIVGPFTIATIGVALAVAYLLWRSVLSPAGALAAAIGSSLVLPAQAGPLPHVSQAWYSPYSCFVAVAGVAWVAATAGALRREGRARLAVLAVVGAVLALTYYLLFLLLAAVVVVLVAVPREGRREALRRAGAVAAAIAVLTSVFWIPLLAAILGGSASQGHYVSPLFVRVAVGLNGPPALAVLAAVVLAALAAAFGAPASRAVAAVLAGAVLYQLLSVTTLVFLHQQLQPHRAATLTWAAFGAALPVVFDRALAARAGVVPRWLTPPGWRLALVATAAVGAAATFALGSSLGTDLAAGPLTRAAYRAAGIGRADAMSRFITSSSGRRPDQVTVATTFNPLLVTHPYYGFLPLRARYAHPKAELSRRLAALRAAASCRDAACTAARLAHTPFGPVGALVLARTPTGLRIVGQEDAFPLPRAVPIDFRPALFDRATWAARDLGPYRVLVRRP